MRSFDNATVVVTGAAAGLGRALCERFGRAGARIVALDRDEDALARTADALRAAGIEAAPIACDVTDERAVKRAMLAGADAFGGIDLLVCNAGISHHSEFARTAPDVVRRVMAVNFFGALHCTHAALPQLLARRGMIIAISSVAGFAPLSGRTGYAASKHALHGLFESLRTELAPEGVEVMLVCPSFIATGIDRHALGPTGGTATHAQVVTGGRLQPDDVADRVFRAAGRGQRQLLVGATAHASWWLSRFAPALFERVMARRLRDEMQ